MSQDIEVSAGAQAGKQAELEKYKVVLPRCPVGKHVVADDNRFMEIDLSLVNQDVLNALKVLEDFDSKVEQLQHAHNVSNEGTDRAASAIVDDKEQVG
jgi:hypothetical protein